jgi:hypothetical protein
MVVLCALVACTGRLDRPTQTTLTSGRVPPPESMPPPSRTVDSSGFVDNSGHTSDQRGRTEASGMRPTEAGGQRPTGTPGSGTPVPAIEPEPTPGKADAPGIGAEGEEQVARFAQARCDWELSCGRVGAGKAHESAQACAMNVRPIVRRELAVLDCAQGYDAQHVGMCLTAIRRATCTHANDVFHTNPDCRPTLVCAL